MEEEAEEKQRQWGKVPSWPFARYEAVDQHRPDGESSDENWLWPPEQEGSEKDSNDSEEEEASSSFDNAVEQQFEAEAGEQDGKEQKEIEEESGVSDALAAAAASLEVDKAVDQQRFEEEAREQDGKKKDEKDKEETLSKVEEEMLPSFGKAVDQQESDEKALQKFRKMLERASPELGSSMRRAAFAAQKETVMSKQREAPRAWERTCAILWQAAEETSESQVRRKGVEVLP
eukprot:4097814-Karenia_brevis.AAC.1